jgi:hypothetical protein
MKFIRPSLLLLAPLALAACDSSQPSYSASNPAPPPAATPSAPAPAPAQPAAPTPAAPAPVAAAAPVNERTGMPARGARPPVAQGITLPPAPQTGIGGCDAYVARYRSCLTSDQGVVAPVQRKYQLAHALARQVRKWQVDIKAGKTSEVAKACSAADSEARDTLGKLGCKAI